MRDLELRERIIEHIRANGPSTAAELADALGVETSALLPEIMHANGRSIRRCGWTDQAKPRAVWGLI